MPKSIHIFDIFRGLFSPQETLLPFNFVLNIYLWDLCKFTSKLDLHRFAKQFSHFLNNLGYFGHWLRLNHLLILLYTSKSLNNIHLWKPFFVPRNIFELLTYFLALTNLILTLLIQLFWDLHKFTIELDVHRFSRQVFHVLANLGIEFDLSFASLASYAQIFTHFY